MEEIWKPIEGFERYYEVSSFGRVRSIRRLVYRDVRGFPRYIGGKILMGSNSGAGYLSVFLMADGKKARRYVHRLVAEAFLESSSGKNCVNHIDGNKRNNRAENLEWCTQEENVRHAFMEGLMNPHHNQSNKRRVEAIKDGSTHCFASIADAAKFIGVAESGVSRACSGEKNTAGGYICRFVND